MNILFLAHGFSPSSGGVERVTSILTDELKRRGHNVVFCQISSDEQRRNNLSAPLFVIEQAGLSKLTHSSINNFIKCLDSNNINIIINQTPAFNRSIELIAIAKQKIKRHIIVISTFHNTPSCYLKTANYYLNNLSLINFKHFLGSIHRHIKLKRNLNNANRYSDKIVLLSENYIDELRSFVPSIPKKKICSIGNPVVEINNSTNTNKENVILFVGRLATPEKNLLGLLRIWKKISIKFPNWRLDLVGNENGCEGIKKYIKENGIKGVSFCGSQDDMKSFYQTSKVVCMTSIFEGWPMVLLEGMANGCVPIVYNTYGAAEEILDKGKNGCLITPNDETSYIENLTHLLMDERLLNLYRKNAQSCVHTWNVDKIVDKWERIFNEF